jgi:hypothetical protein
MDRLLAQHAAARRRGRCRFVGIEQLESRIQLSAAASVPAGVVTAIDSSAYKYRTDALAEQSAGAVYGKTYVNPLHNDAQTFFNRFHDRYKPYVKPTPTPTPTPTPIPTPTPTPTPDPTPSPTPNPVAITQAAAGNLTRLIITGTSGNDAVVISQSGDTLTITANGTTSTVSNPIGEIAIYGNDGNDTLTVQSSVTIPTLVYGGAGNNTLTDLAAAKSFIVSLGAGYNTLSGNGHTSFWANPLDVISGGTTATIHRVAAFYQPFSSTPGSAGYIASYPDGQNLRDPTDSGATTRLTNSLWGAGPTMTDMNQGSIGDCYFLASLQSLALQQPALLENMAVDLGDGSYAVMFQRGGTTTYVRVDGDLPAGGFNGLAYAHPSGGGPQWEAIFEKAYAFFRTGAATYSSLNWGWTGSALADLGIATTTFTTGGGGLFSTLTTALAGGKAVAAITNSNVAASVPVVASHAYTVVSTSVVSGTQYVTLRNPWGIDGAGSDSNPLDGLVTLTFAQFQSGFSSGSIQI